MEFLAKRGWWAVGALLQLLLCLTGVPTALSEEIHYESANRRDPFGPLVGEDGVLRKGIVTSGLMVEGIIYDPRQGSMALINGELYKEGDHVGGANVFRIYHDRVILVQKDEQKILWIREEILEGDAKKDESARQPAA